AFPIRPAENPKAKQGGVTYGLGDIDVLDWNIDGRLDFLFYDRAEGLFWIPNLGTPQSPEWATFLGPDLEGHDESPLYSHRANDGSDFAEGTFAVRQNPDIAVPSPEWLDELYISVNSRLRTFRYYTDENDYRLLQTNAVADPAGQGAPAFWDFDLDGDLDLFR